MGYLIRDIAGPELIVGNSNYLSVTATMTSETWNTAATHEVFTVTGIVRARMWIQCTGTLTDAADGAAMQFGHEGDTDIFIATTNCARAGAGLIEATDLWFDNAPLTAKATSSAVLDQVVYGSDIGYEITGAALTGGVLVFHCIWEPLSSGATLTAGTGAALV